MPAACSDHSRETSGAEPDSLLTYRRVRVALTCTSPSVWDGGPQGGKHGHRGWEDDRKGATAGSLGALGGRPSAAVGASDGGAACPVGSDGAVCRRRVCPIDVDPTDRVLSAARRHGADAGAGGRGRRADRPGDAHGAGALGARRARRAVGGASTPPAAEVAPRARWPHREVSGRSSTRDAGRGGSVHRARAGDPRRCSDARALSQSVWLGGACGRAPRGGGGGQAPFCLGSTHYGGAFLLLPFALLLSSLAERTLGKVLGSADKARRLVLSLFFRAALGIERIFHFETLDDPGFALLTGGVRVLSRSRLGGLV